MIGPHNSYYIASANQNRLAKHHRLVGDGPLLINGYSDTRGSIDLSCSTDSSISKLSLFEVNGQLKGLNTKIDFNEKFRM